MLLQELLETHPLIDEGVPIRDLDHLAAYAITVAEAYDKLPVHDPKVTPLWHGLAAQNETLLRQIAARGIKVEYTPDDPYSAHTDDPKMMVRYMLWDMVVNHRLAIYSGHSDHPAFNPEQNVAFRTVHDFFTHGKLVASFARQIKQRGLDRNLPTPTQLAQILPTIRLDLGGNIGHSFSLRGEINAYLTHAKLASPKTLPVLFTEVIGQACYNTVVGQFPAQKVAIMPGFDYHQIGLGEHESHPVQRRIDDLIAQIEAKQPTLRTRIAAKPTVVVADLMRSLSR